MLRWIYASTKFLFWLGVLQLARLLVVLFCIGQVIAVLALWGFAFAQYIGHNRPIYLWIPIGATCAVALQVTLWRFAWLRVAQRGGRWRALAECFCAIVRYPIVRTPFHWE